MRERTYEYCLNKIFSDIEKRRTVDYLDKNSVRRYNAASDRIYDNFAYIDDHFPDRIADLMEYVDAEKLEFVWFFIFGICKMKNATREQKIFCINTLRKIYDNPEVDEIVKMSIPTNIERLESRLYM